MEEKIFDILYKKASILNVANALDTVDDQHTAMVFIRMQ